MSTPNLPRKSAANTQHALRVLAVGKYLTNLIRGAEAQAKAYLMEKELQPKDRRTVGLEDGTDIGTVSMVQGRRGAPRRAPFPLRREDPGRPGNRCGRKPLRDVSPIRGSGRRLAGLLEHCDRPRPFG